MITLAKARQKAALIKAKGLESLNTLEPDFGASQKIAVKLEPIFEKLRSPSLVDFRKTAAAPADPLKLGVVFSGGPAAGGHNVVLGLWEGITQIHPQSELVGFLGGPDGILKNRTKPLGEEQIAAVKNYGGFYLLGSGRTKIETKEQMETALKVVQGLKLQGLVIVGGDDSNTNAALLAEFFIKNGESASVIGIPKTIDGDLKNQWIELSFGFDTASKIYSEMVGNLIADAASQEKYTFFVKVMGRTASHLVLETAMQARPHLVLISEEIKALGWTLDKVVSHICELLEERSKAGKNYGVILLPEGVIEFIPDFMELLKELSKAAPSSLTSSSKQLYDSLPQVIQEQLLLEKDPHGNIPVSKIETERLLISLVDAALKKRGLYKGAFAPQGYFCGYEGRSGFPTPFDATYCYNLGLTAALLVRHRLTGCMAVLKGLSAPPGEWKPMAVPLPLMMDVEERKGSLKPVIQKSLVDLQGELFRSFSEERRSLRLKDHLDLPGPIQFGEPFASTFSLPYLLQATDH
jgi:pyrophosphate--fructose-6-phosphate 1-phosphotransferase